MDNTNNASNDMVNGFKVGADGKLRADGKMVSASIAEAARNGEVMFGFDLASLKRQKQQKANGKTDLAAELRKISPRIEELKVGMTVKLPIPKQSENGKDPKRAFVMSVVSKLNNLTAAGKEWAGKVFDTMADAEGNFLYVARQDDTDSPKVRNVSNGGRRVRDTGLGGALEAARRHLNGSGGDATPKEAEEAEAILNDGAVVKSDGGEGEVIEEAEVIKA